MEEFLNKIKDKRILIDFYADWCGPCKMQGEIFKSFNDLEVLKINVDENIEIAQKFGVMSIPTIILMDNQKEIKRNVGLLNISELKEFIK